MTRNHNHNHNNHHHQQPNTPKTIVFLDRQTFPRDIVLARPSIAHEWIAYDETAPELIVPRLQDADIAITNKVVLNADVLAQLPQLKLIVVSATGYNNVDIDYCKAHGIAVCNVTAYAKQTVAEHTIAMILTLSRHLLAYHNDVLQQHWHQSPIFCLHHHPMNDLCGKTIGLIGQGAIGLAVAELASAFKMHVQFLAPSEYRNSGNSGNTVDTGNLHHETSDSNNQAKTHPYACVSWETFLATSDIISLHCPLTKDTANLIDRKAYQQMQKKPMIINTARGGIANEADTVQALANQQISAIGFDTLTQEPMTTTHPFQPLLGQPNVMITPHNAWASQDAMKALWSQVIRNIELFCQGQIDNRIV